MQELNFDKQLDGEAIAQLGNLRMDFSQLNWLERYGMEIAPAFISQLQTYWPLPIVLSLAYITLIFAGQHAMRQRAAFHLRTAMIAWNLSLATLSLVGASRLFSLYWHVARHHSFALALCHPHWYHNRGILWAVLFLVSKPVELGDTAFIVLRKQPLIFLHWYHHVTVMLYVWYSAVEHSAPGFLFLTLNYAVHAVMYAYYAVRAARLRPRMPGWVPRCVTRVQLSQMCVGVCVLGAVAYRQRVQRRFCQMSGRLLVCGTLMYASYAVLFARFYVTAYLKKKQEKKKTRQN